MILLSVYSPSVTFLKLSNSPSKGKGKLVEGTPWEVYL